MSKHELFISSYDDSGVGRLMLSQSLNKQSDTDQSNIRSIGTTPQELL